ncbi:hypothetical protein M3672_15030 [Microbacterium enclense]|uniref:hypothetical protein n=1 Tax=Microbacterium enclense TaxID=993073 RepID=UPI0020418DD7|nr:hypothetical protein [Microbacterium enclense]MCM3615744.1 hypothetical protein [Microbacterium enclense]
MAKTKTEPTTVYQVGDAWTLDEPDNKNLTAMKRSAGFKELPAEMQKAIEAQLSGAEDSTEVEDWETQEFKREVYSWLKSHAPSVEKTRAVARHVVRALALKASTFEEHEAVRDDTGLAIKQYIAIVNPTDKDGNYTKGQNFSQAVLDRYLAKSQENFDALPDAVKKRLADRKKPA